MELLRRVSRIDQLNRAVAFAAIGNCVLCKGFGPEACYLSALPVGWESLGTQRINAAPRSPSAAPSLRAAAWSRREDLDIKQGHAQSDRVREMPCCLGR